MVTILLAEEDPDDRLLLQDVFEQTKLQHELRFVGDGEELINYLFRCGHYADPAISPRPALLDFNMPRKDGRETLEEIKSNPSLKVLPVIVLTTSHSKQDMSLKFMRWVAAHTLSNPVPFRTSWSSSVLLAVIGWNTSNWRQSLVLRSAVRFFLT